jgi:hypothetical protein
MVKVEGVGRCIVEFELVDLDSCGPLLRVEVKGTA